MTSTLNGVAVSRPLVELLPGVLQEDEFTQRFTGGLDAVVASVFACLDALETYVDPIICPDDFLPWLAGWVGVIIDENWPIERQRAFIQSAVQLFRTRGTLRGLKSEVELLTGGEVEVSETGGVAVSTVPNGPIPGEDYPRCSLRVTLPRGSTVTDRSVALVIEAAKPAHVVYAVEIVRSGSRRAG
ncbi:MAG TPA: phage tail protein I [Acidimicrobiia bacterium]|nr:phage tail protein I [Acidimicrobiia bacterium]